MSNMFARPKRSTIVPGRRTPRAVALVEAGFDLDNSYQNVPTESDRSPVNNTSSNRTMNTSRGETTGTSVNSSPPNVSYNRNSDRHAPALPATSPAIANAVSQTENINEGTRTRPQRHRLPPVRFWLGERAVYSWHNDSFGEFLRVSKVFSSKSLERLEKDERTMRTRLSKKNGSRKRKGIKSIGPAKTRIMKK